jgi:hypothetical protein
LGRREVVHVANRSRRWSIRVLTITAVLGLVLSVGAGSVAARPTPGLTSHTCSLFPGDTTLTWDSWSGRNSLDLNWYSGDTLLEHVVLQPTHAMNGVYTHPTPGTADTFTVVVVRRSGEVVGGVGMSCT